MSSTTHEHEPTVYERADRYVLRCWDCCWSDSYEGEEIDEITDENGCLDPEKVDGRCPSCGKGVQEDFVGAEVR